MYISDSEERPQLKVLDEVVSRRNFHLAVCPEVLGSDVGVVMWFSPSHDRCGMIQGETAFFEIPTGVDQHFRSGDLVSFKHRDNIAEDIRVIAPAQHVFGGMQVFRNNYKN